MKIYSPMEITILRGNSKCVVTEIPLYGLPHRIPYLRSQNIHLVELSLKGCPCRISLVLVSSIQRNLRIINGLMIKNLFRFNIILVLRFWIYPQRFPLRVKQQYSIKCVTTHKTDFNLKSMKFVTNFENRFKGYGGTPTRGPLDESHLTTS